jgi:hypothetical protein
MRVKTKTGAMPPAAGSPCRPQLKRCGSGRCARAQPASSSCRRVRLLFRCLATADRSGTRPCVPGRSCAKPVPGSHRFPGDMGSACSRDSRQRLCPGRARSLLRGHNERSVQVEPPPRTLRLVIERTAVPADLGYIPHKRDRRQPLFHRRQLPCGNPRRQHWRLPIFPAWRLNAPSAVRMQLHRRRPSKSTSSPAKPRSRTAGMCAG